MKISTTLTVIIPNIFSWLLASLLLLIYSFDILEKVEASPNNPFLRLGILILGFILFLIVFMLYFTGTILDKHPEYLRVSVLVGMVGSSISVIVTVVFIDESILLMAGLISLAFFFGILLTSSGTLFAGLTDIWYRGRTYSYGIFAFIVVTLLSILLGGGFSHQFQSGLLSHSFVSVLIAIGVLGLILSLIFVFLTRNLGIPWKNDKWPTKFGKIIGRRSVRAYLISHILLYTMLGISIASFSQIGEILNISWTIGEFDLPVDKTFWFVVLVGDLLMILPAGYYSDRFGRKNMIVAAIYGLVFASLIFGLEQTPTSFLIAALVIGFSFALIHPTLDSSLWADLSPRDGLGRYYAIGFVSLAIGLGVGSAFGHWYLKPIVTDLTTIEFITYLLTILAILAAFPLFWVSDSYKPLDFNLLLVIEEGGLPIFDYTFNKELDTSIELTLLSGALKAVSSFMSETMKDKGELNLVRHGNHFILTEIKGGLSTAIFSNKQDPELHTALRDFLEKFHTRYAETLKNWGGTRSLFDGAVDIAEEVFGHLAPSTNLDD
ncbi:MAG: MFS transporter [Candidatus Heimdallarchaeota archaeon]|nr:MAG: MFS transporter [Candidatus Heimdallarchaeota archaeon]